MAIEASTSTSRYAFHVFISFRGEDTPKHFTDHLYTALVNSGLRTFRADDEIERGEDVKIELETAIQRSRSSVIVMSKDYASSGRCLDDLAMIVDQKRRFDHIILPVFYDVDPSHVRKQTGSFGTAFDEYEKRCKAETDEKKRESMRERMEGWRAALKEVADLGGFVLENQADGHESKFIQIIVQEIVSKLDFTVLSVTPHATGIDTRVKDINLWLQGDLNNVGIMVIRGMGGIGKTTIAKTVYNQNFDKFEGSSFLLNIRETAKQPNGLVRLQKQLVADISNGKKGRLYSVDEGVVKIKDAMCCKRVLLVFDDVDESDQVNALFGRRDWFHPGSKIVITTRHEQLLKADVLHDTYTVKELNDDEGLCLFSRHAFGKDQPIEDYTRQSIRITHYCGGLPLALEVLGTSLSGKSVDVWEHAIAKLKTHFDEKIYNVLRVSFDSLDYHEKNLFLDIACFFIGKDKDYMVKILEDDDFPIAAGFQNLIRRGLLKVNEQNNELMMHQLLRDMGREIIRRESPKEPGRRSRLWCHKDASNVLRERTGTEKIEGLSLYLEEVPGAGVDNAQPFQFEGSSANSLEQRRGGILSWLRGIPALTVSYSESVETVLNADAFSMMHKLRLLQLNNIRLTGSYKEFPKKLRWLCWHQCPFKFIPNDFPLESLAVLDMQHSHLEQCWKRTRLLRSLKILDLSYSQGLASSPDFSQLPNLERVILKHCINLVEVHDSIGELTRLVFLNLEGCESLKKLPKGTFQIRSLEKLILTGCLRLERLPSDLNKMESLEVLGAEGLN